MICWTMSLRISLLMLMSMVSSVYLQSREDMIVEHCKEESRMFTESEWMYVVKNPNPDDPNPVGPQNKYLQQEVYAREIRQRPFECITDYTEKEWGLNMATSSNYQALVQDCMLKRPKPSCIPGYKFRTFDGTCNNQFNWKWGSLFSCLRRYLPAHYDGASGMRQSVCGGPLPSPRLLSVNIYADDDRPAKAVTHILTFFGQFLAHDITDVSTSFVGTQTIECCKNLQGPQHPQCAPIFIDKDDEFFSKFNITCFNFARTVPFDTCSIGKRNQINQETSYIDLSLIYGLTDQLAQNLRWNGTKLKTQYRETGDLLPRDYSLGECDPEKENECFFLAGDRRVNQHTPLTCLHTLFVREHNRIADELRKYNPTCSDEYIYQEARNINIAQFQVIVFKEFLPALLGPEFMTKYGLSLPDIGFTTYDPNVDATLWVEFNTAAYRLHSIINGIVTYYEVETCKKRFFKNEFGDVGPLYHGKMTSLMKGISLSPAQKYDKYFTNAMSDYLYKPPKRDYGFDIISFNIQRGRDNGLPTYIDFVNDLSNGTINIQNFDDLHILMEPKNIDMLRDMYCDARDIDLFVGLTNERISENMGVGPTGGELIAKQFSNLRHGDRFFFQHYGNFYESQLETLKTVTLSSILCLNTDINSMQLKAMKFPSKKNPLMCCDSIPKVDLRRFKVCT